MNGKPTINDIAQKAGVSLSTVSLVLNNKPGISQETRRRVLEVAEQLAYPIKGVKTATTLNLLSDAGDGG